MSTPETTPATESNPFTNPRSPALLWFVHFDGHGVPSLPSACPCADCFPWGVRSVVWLAWLRCNALRCKCVAVSRSFDGLSGLLCGLRVCVASLGLALAL